MADDGVIRRLNAIIGLLICILVLLVLSMLPPELISLGLIALFILSSLLIPILIFLYN
ncbi:MULTISPECIES: hypothetical protein [unclassified Natrinema]|uniref:hypothetical protein n=1 Tax=unclassified Natrinema TaxID=2622230 RepID=UPI00026D48E1|nr:MULTISPECIES: hypothetical protein [unclassified Natrinema]AFO59155.1 hypothetical protein NJ7G_3941 [Natrinema sp. J7-2]